MLFEPYVRFFGVFFLKLSSGNTGLRSLVLVPLVSV